MFNKNNDVLSLLILAINMEKKIGYFVCAFIFLTIVNACGNRSVASINRDDLDSFKYGWAMSHHYFVGNNIYPKTRDSISANKIQSQKILTIFLMSDTLVLIAHDDVFYSKEFPIDSTSIIKKYGRKFTVLFDDDIPYYAFIRNDNDTIEFCKENNLFYPQAGHINSYDLSIAGFQKGQEIREVLSSLNIDLPKELSYNYIAIVSCEVIEDIWYKKYYVDDQNNSFASDFWYSVVLLQVIDQKINSIIFGMNGTETLISIVDLHHFV